MLYEFLDRLFPKSFGLKIMAVAFLGTHIPLLFFAAYIFTSSGLTTPAIKSLIVILLATLIGTGITLYLIQKLLAPIRQTVDVMMRHEDRQPVELLPDNYQDELGFLMKAANTYMTHTGDQLRRYRNEAEIDPLTKALNRRGLNRNVLGKTQGWLLHFDIDDFKKINDEYGHATGDTVLIALSDRIHALLRADDLFARVGGEEFVLFMEGSLDNAICIVEAIRASLRDEPVSGVRLTLSMGLVEYTDDIEATLIAADRATYSAKRAGKNQVVIKGSDE